MTFILNPESIAEAKALGLPDDLLRRWNMAQQNNRLLEYRELSIWLASEAYRAWRDFRVSPAFDLFALSEIAYRMQLDLQPKQEAA